MAGEKYTILEKIGSGGMAEVYRARISGAAGFQKTVAIKRLLPHLTAHEEFVEMFIEEARLLSSLTHPNIVQVFNFEQAGSEYLLVMEYVHGRTLSQLLQRCKKQNEVLSAGLIAYIIAEAATGLAYAHNKTDEAGKHLNIVHRDISPQNILISSDGLVKVTDFGIAKAATSTSFTREGFLKGKMVYLSPEAAWGKKVDRRSDIFSLGLVAFQMASGRVLFRRESDLEVLQAVREWSGLKDEDRTGNVPVKLWEIIGRMLEPEPEKRYQAAEEAARELKLFVQQTSPASGPAELSETVLRLFYELTTDPLKIRTDERPLDLQIASAIKQLDLKEETPAETKSISQALAGKEQPTSVYSAPSSGRPWRGLLIAAVTFLIAASAASAWYFYSMTQNGISIANQLEDGGMASADIQLGVDGVEPSQLASVPQTTDGGAGGDEDQALARSDLAETGQKTEKTANLFVRKPQPAKMGALTLNSEPWAYVEINGKRLEKPTPIVNHRLPAGTYKIRLTNPVVNKSKTITVVIKAGETARHVVRL